MTAALRRAALAAAAAWGVAMGPPAVAADGTPAAQVDGRAALFEADAGLYRDAFQAAGNGKWSFARMKAGKAADPLLAKALHWLWLFEDEAEPGFAARAKFIREYPDWPGLDRLRRLGEESMEDSTPDSTVLDWFSDYEPITTHGRVRLAEALERRGEHERTRTLLRRAWREGNFGLREERTFLARHRGILTPEDDVARLDRLLWEGRSYPAKRMLPRVSEAQRKLAEARMRLRRMQGGVDWAIAQVPDELKDDPGLAYERLRWRRKRERDNAFDILKDPPADLVRPKLWWNERAILARRALQAGDISVAYRTARDHGIEEPEGVAYVEAEWLAGWIALRLLRDEEIAIEHFARVFEASKYPISRARGAYWAGRAAHAMRKLSLAEDWYRRAAQYVTTYHGQLAAFKLEDGRGYRLPADPVPTREERAAFEANELTRVARQLAGIGELDLVEPFVLRLQELAKTPGAQALAGALALELGRPDAAVKVAKEAVRAGVTLVDTGYPAVYEVDGGNPEPALIHAIMRQESSFDIAARSGAGARGLMQIMPATARNVAKSLRIKYSTSRLRNDPQYNLTLGRAYLDRLLGRYDGSYVLALAAYNAGPARVRRWMRELGDPRTPEVDAIDWIEMIPYSETRTYVQRVLENLQVYRARMGTLAVASSLEADLHFRGPQ